MSLAPGTRVGPYEILAPLGAGGMGEVYRARDPRLGRDVAIKVLPSALRAEPERLARFEREARVLASLNHPRIGALLGLEEADGVPALVLELIEGPTLAQHLTLKGALPASEAIEVARAIAEAMEYAHERGIVHRDLKPANVKFTADGAVKVLDFGLAKALLGEEGAGSDPLLSHSPTMTVGTQAGMILGTAAYMAPEQARGRTVDRRADIWAFGVILFEMLAGRALFAGETVSDTIARILEREPDWNLLPNGTPDRLRELLRRCLAKDPRERLRDIGDARLELEAAARDLASGVVPVQMRHGRGAAFSWALAAVLTIVAAALGAVLGGRMSKSDEGVARLSVIPPADLAVRALWVSPDGKTMLARGDSNDGKEGAAREHRIYVRRLDRFDWQALPGTDGVSSYDVTQDGRWVNFVAPVAPGSRSLQLSRIALDGGSPPAALLPWSERWTSWESLPNGGIAVTVGGDSLGIIPPGKTLPSVWRAIRFSAPIQNFTLDETLPDGSACLCTIGYFGANGWTYAAVALDLATGVVHTIATNAASPRRTPQGHMLFTRGSTVLVTRFDSKRFEPIGEAVALFDGVRLSSVYENGIITTSARGALSYVPGTAKDRQRWVAVLDGTGRSTEWCVERGSFEGAPTVSPDGQNVIVMNVPAGAATFELLQLSRGRPGARRIASAVGEDCAWPEYSPDGHTVAFLRQGRTPMAGVYVTARDFAGEARCVLPAKNGTDEFDQPAAWSPDGSTLYVNSWAQRRWRIRRIRFGASEPVVEEVHRAEFDVSNARLSSDGRTLAFLQTETGPSELSVASLDANGRVTTTVQISRGGATQARWVPRTRELLFTTPQKQLMRVRVTPELAFSPPEPVVSLVDVTRNDPDFTVAPDGSIVLVHRAKDEDDVRQFNLVLGFDREVEAALQRSAKR